MLRPVIFIGCGGSGTKAVRYIRDAVDRRLKHRGWNRGMPEAWQFICLDTLTVQESPTEIPTVPPTDFLSLSAAYSSYRGLHKALTQHYPVGGSNDSRMNAHKLCGWLPDPRTVNVPLRDGAGQNRGIGRAAGLLSLESALLDRLKEAFRRTAAGGPALREVGTYLGVDSEAGGNTAEPLVTVCSSMAGGTGAGVVLDVVDLVRACDHAGRHPALVLFTNDIFDMHKSRPMAANSLGLMSELLAAYWSQPGEIESPLSGQYVKEPGMGPHSVFLVGRHSYSGASLGDTAEVYRAAGEAMSTWVVDDVVQEQIHNFINVNWRNTAKDNHGGYPFAREHQFGVLSSFGAAKVTVGRDRFTKWAEDLLARQVMESLAAGHMRLSSFANRLQDDSEAEVVEKAAERYADPIFRGRTSAARSRGGDLQGCFYAREAFASDAQLHDVRRGVLEELKLPAGQLASGGLWRDNLRKNGKRMADQYKGEAESRRGFDWCQSMMIATCRSVSDVVAVSSLDVAIEALSVVIDKIVPAAVKDIRTAARSDIGNGSKLIEDSLNELASVADNLAGDSPQVRQAADGVAKGVALMWRSWRLEIAAETVAAAGPEVFGAIRRAVRAAREEVGIALSDDDAKAWPAGVEDIAKRYLPSTVELPLESHSVWPDLLGELCAEARTEGVAAGNRPTDPLRHRLIAGDLDIEALVLPGEHHRWSPGQHAYVTCHAGIDDIKGRVHKWTRRQSKFKRVVGEGLSSYLSESDPTTGQMRTDHHRRMEMFREQLGNAKQVADPLMRIDLDLYRITNSEDLEPFLTVCSQFPFGKDHPAEEAAKNIVGQASYQASPHDTSSVLVSSYVTHPTYPMAVRSFTEPVASALQSSREPDKRASQFWMWRRSRTLEAFVPVPRETLKSMIAGFAVARLCGYVTVDSSRPIRISASQNGEALFPYPLLTTRCGQNDLLASLLESFCLTFGAVGAHGMDVYVCYERLHALGDHVQAERVPADLSQLLEFGAPPHPTVDGEMPKALGATESERSEAAKRYLKLNIDYFEQQHPNKMRAHMMRSLDGATEPGAMTSELALIYIECYNRLLKLLEEPAEAQAVI